MTDHQGLTDEQIELLRSLPRPLRLGVANDLLKFGELLEYDGLGFWKRSRTADTLLETLDHHTAQAAEAERRRIDGLAERLRVLENAGEAMAIARRMELSERLRNEPLARDGLLDEWNDARNALHPDTPPQEAATQAGSES